MRIISGFIGCLLACSSTPAAAPQDAPAPTLFPAMENGRLGYIDRTGAFVIKPKFDGGGGFSDGLALVTTGNDYAYITPAGVIVITLKSSEFNIARAFSEGMAVVGNRGPGDAIEETLGYIDKTGTLVIALQFDHARAFSEGLAVASRRRSRGFINKSGTFVIEPQYGVAESFSGGFARVGSYVQGLPREHFVDRTGARAIRQQFRFIDDFSEGLAAVWVGEQKGYIDRTGALVIPPQSFNSASRFSDGMARIQVGGPMGKGGRLGYIDRTGRIVVKPEYEFAGDFSDGLCAVRIGDKYGYIDKTGVVVVAPQFGTADPFRDGLARVWFDDKTGYVDKTGKFIWQARR